MLKNLLPPALQQHPLQPRMPPPAPTPAGKELRRLALTLDIPTVTTINGAWCNKEALRHLRTDKLEMTAIQDFFPNYYDDSMDIIMESC